MGDVRRPELVYGVENYVTYITSEASAYMDYLEAAVAQLRHDRDVLAENLSDVRDAVWRMGMNEILQRYNEDRKLSEYATASARIDNMTAEELDAEILRVKGMRDRLPRTKESPGE